MAIRFQGAVGSNDDGNVEWTDVIKYEGSPPSYMTQFGTAYSPGAGDDIVIGTEVTVVRLSSSTYEHLGTPVVMNDLTIEAGATLNQVGGTLSVYGLFTNNGSYDLSGGAYYFTEEINNNWLMTFGKDTPLASSFMRLMSNDGKFVLSGATGDLRMRGDYITGFVDNGTVTELSNQSRISGFGTIGADFGWASFPSDAGLLSFVNETNGVIDANVADRSLTFHTQLSSSYPVWNYGLMQASNGGDLEFTGGYAVDSNLVIWIRQGVDGVLKALTGSSVTIIAGFLEGGKLTTEGTGVIKIEGFGSELRDLEVTTGSHVVVDRSINLAGSIVNRGEIEVTGFHAGVGIDAEGLTLTGGGKLSLVGNYGRTSINTDGSDVTLNNVDNEIRGVGEIYGVDLINSGIISAEDLLAQAQKELHVEVKSLTNTGTMRALDGMDLRIYSPTDGSSVLNDGGIIRADGTNEAGTRSSTVSINAVIQGGTYDSSDGGYILAQQFTMDGRTYTVTNEGEVRVDYSGWLGLMGSIVNEGHIKLEGRNNIIIKADTTLSGGGTISLKDGFETSNITTDLFGTTLTNVDNTIRGSGRIGTDYYPGTTNGLHFVNGLNGEVIADQVGQALLLRTGETIVNNGLIQAKGGILDLRDHITGTGSIQVTDAGWLRLNTTVDSDVTFVGDGHETVELTRINTSDTTYDLDFIGMGVGDRIKIFNYGNIGEESTFALAYTDDGVSLKAGYWDDYTINLKGEYSEGQFRLIVGTDGYYGFVRVTTKDGTSGNNTLTAVAGGERLIGLAGNDTLISGAGDDVLDGGKGTDSADYTNATSGVTVNLGLSTTQNVGGGQGSDRLILIENLLGSQHADKLTGNTGDNVLKGRGGADTLYGGGGTDTMTGGSGADIFVAALYYTTSSIQVTDFTAGDKIGTDGYAAIQSLSDIAALVLDKSNTTNAVLTFDRYGQVTTMELTGIDWRNLKVTDFSRLNNTAPNLYFSSETSLQENTAASTVVLELAGIDQEGDKLAYTLSGDDAAFFTIDSSGNLKFKAAPNFEAKADKNHDNTYSLTVNVSDGAVTTSKVIAINVTNINEAPVITGGATKTITVNENVTGSFYKVAATDQDAGTELTYSFSNIEGFFNFDIDENGNVSFQQSPNFESPHDMNYDGVYQVVVTVSDGYHYATQTLNITVKDVNEAPRIVTDFGYETTARNVHENTSGVLASIGAVDPEGKPLTYSLVSGDDSAFFSVTASGVLSLKAGLDFENKADTNKDGTYKVTVQVSDGVNTDRQTFLVGVMDRMEAPKITSNGGGDTAVISVAENTTAVTTVKALDQDAGSTLVYSIIDGADKAKFAIDKTTGSLKFVGAPDFDKPGDADKNNSYSVKVQVTDGSFTDTQVLTVNVTNVNEAPSITSNGSGSEAAISVKENAITVTKVIATDPDASTKMTYSIQDGADKTKFSIDKATGALTFIGAPDFERPGDSDKDNTYNIRVKVTDGTLSDYQTLTIKVTNVDGVKLNGKSTDEAMTGTAEADTLKGLGGNDTIKALGGEDMIWGGTGADDLHGGVDGVEDIFVFEKGDTGKTASTWDQIFDFKSGVDKIDLSRIDADPLAGVQDLRLVTKFEKATAKQNDGQFRLVDTGKHFNVEIDYDGNATIDAIIQVMDVESLSRVDFLL